MSYKHLAGPESLWIMKREWQIKFLRSQGLLSSHTLLDFGCGPLRGGIPLIKYLDIGMYTGIDIREECIDAAEHEIAEHNLIEKQPSIGAYHPHVDYYDFIWCFSVWQHLTGQQLSEIIPILLDALTPGGKLFANVNMVESFSAYPPEGEWQGFPVCWNSFDWYEGYCPSGWDMEDIGTLAELGHDSGKQNQDQQVMLKMERE